MKLSVVGSLALLGIAEATQKNVQRRGGGARLDKLGLFEAAPLPHRRQAGNDSMTSVPAPATTSPPPSSAVGSDPGVGAVTTQLVTVNQSVAVTTTQSLWNNSTVTLTLPCSSCAGGLTTTTATLPCTTTPLATIPSTTADPAPIVSVSPSPTTVWASGTVAMTVPCPVCTQVSPQPTSAIVFVSANCTWTQSAAVTTTPVITTSMTSSAVWVSGGTVTMTIPCSTTLPQPWSSVSVVPVIVVITAAPVVVAPTSVVPVTRVPVLRLSTSTIVPFVAVPTAAPQLQQSQQPTTSKSKKPILEPIPSLRPTSTTARPTSTTARPISTTATQSQQPTTSKSKKPILEPIPSLRPTSTTATTKAAAPVKTAAAATYGISTASGLLFGLSGAAFALL